MNPTLTALFTALDALEGRATVEVLAELLSSCDIQIDDVASHVRYSERAYTRIPLNTGEHYQAWVMCWRNGQRSPIHDHRGSSCAVRVMFGTLTETLFDFAPNGQVKATFSRDFLPGEVITGGDGDMHQVSNLQAEEADLVTLHVYSPPLVNMGIYDLFSRKRTEEPMMQEFIDAAGI